MDDGGKYRHAEQVAEQKKYWDYRECRWLACESPVTEIPEQAPPDDRQTTVEVAAGGETSSRA